MDVRRGRPTPSVDARMSTMPQSRMTPTPSPSPAANHRHGRMGSLPCGLKVPASPNSGSRNVLLSGTPRPTTPLGKKVVQPARSVSPAEKNLKMHGDGPGKEELQIFAGRVDKLKDKMDWLFEQPDGILRAQMLGKLPFEDQLTPLPEEEYLTSWAGGKKEDAGSGSNGSWSQAESEIEAAVDAKVAVVLDVALRKFHSFAYTCLYRFSEELTKERDKKNQAMRDHDDLWCEIGQLRREVQAIGVNMRQSNVQQSKLPEEAGVLPDNRRGLLPGDLKMAQGPATPWVTLSDPEKKNTWEELPVGGDTLGRSASNHKLPPASPSQSKDQLCELEGISSKCPLPKGGDVSKKVTPGGYWDEASIGAWYSDTSKLVRETNDLESVHQIIKRRWGSAESHIPPSARPIIWQGLDEMKQKIAGKLQKQIDVTVDPKIMGA